MLAERVLRVEAALYQSEFEKPEAQKRHNKIDFRWAITRLGIVAERQSGFPTELAAALGRGGGAGRQELSSKVALNSRPIL